jgi:acyl-lipid omega-6 desaturase (Delta-12 desaturase)
MSPDSSPVKDQKTKPAWYQGTASYARPDSRKATWQIVNSLVPYLLLLALMYQTVHRGYPWWTTLLLATAAVAFFTRIFIIFHDCTHGSFLPSPRLNRGVGYVLGILTFTPFDDWRRTHAGHHMTAGDLDRRGIGDIWTLTVEEYRSASFLKRLGYRLYRSPLVMFGIGPGWVFLLRNRWPFRGWKRRDLYSVLFTDAAIAAIAGAATVTVGFRTYVAVQLPVLLIAATLGVWLFYIQHNFQGVYWARHGELDPMRVALEGASFYKLPKPLQWVTGNIGLHHLHHVRPGIPNYRLQECFDATPEVHITPLTIRTSPHSLRLKLLDEEGRRMVGFGFADVAEAAAEPGRPPLHGLPAFLIDIWNVFLLHGVVAHVNNGLVPAAAFLLVVALISGDAYVDRTVLHLLLIALGMIPVSFVSGVRDWKRKFRGGRAPVFYRKMWLTGLLFLLMGSAVIIRLSYPGLLESHGPAAWIYAGCVFASASVVVMLGHYGAKLASARK